MSLSRVVWQPVPALALRYAIESADARALDKARPLFAPWLIESEEVEVARSWRIEKDGDRNGDCWRVTNASDEHIPDGEPRPRWHGQPLGELLTQIEYAAIGHLVAHLPPAFIGLHGALLSREFGGKFGGARRAVVLVGPKEAGKSTLACALWRAGWTLHCDDFTLLDANARAHPTARRVSLRVGSRELLGEELWQGAQATPCARPAPSGLLFHPHEIDGAPRANGASGPLEIGAVCFLKRREAEIAPAQTAPIEGIAAAFALLPYTTLLLQTGEMNLAPQEGAWGVKLGQLATRIAGLKLVDIGRGEPEAMVRAIERLAAISSESIRG